MNHTEQIQMLAEQVRLAAEVGTPLAVQGTNSRAFYGREVAGEPLSTTALSGIVSYEPSELVVTTGAGTPLRDLERILASEGQRLAFEPPHFSPSATLGGAVGCGLSGPGRPFVGALRDYVLGVRCINGRGQVLVFGGQVMKNVAGFDLSRLLAGSLGTLAVLLEVSLKVLPLVEIEQTLVRECDRQQALARMTEVCSRALPVTALAHWDGRLYLRLSGAEPAVVAAAAELGGEPLSSGTKIWADLKEQRLAFFDRDRPLWRLSLPPAAPMPDLGGDWLIDWGGAQRWLYSDDGAEAIRAAAMALGGHAQLFRGGDRHGQVFSSLPPAMLALQQRLKQAFDPAGILNHGRMYREL